MNFHFYFRVLHNTEFIFVTIQKNKISYEEVTKILKEHNIYIYTKKNALFKSQFGHFCRAAEALESSLKGVCFRYTSTLKSWLLLKNFRDYH